MNNSSSQERLARIEGQQELILRSLERAEEGRRSQYESIESINLSMTSMDGRLGVLEKSFAVASPTIDEFVKLKGRISDAGKLGKWLWLVVAGLISLVFRFRMEMLAWLGKH